MSMYATYAPVPAQHWQPQPFRPRSADMDQLPQHQLEELIMESYVEKSAVPQAPYGDYFAYMPLPPRMAQPQLVSPGWMSDYVNVNNEYVSEYGTDGAYDSYPPSIDHTPFHSPPSSSISTPSYSPPCGNFTYSASVNPEEIKYQLPEVSGTSYEHTTIEFEQHPLPVWDPRNPAPEWSIFGARPQLLNSLPPLHAYPSPPSPEEVEAAPAPSKKRRASPDSDCSDVKPRLNKKQAVSGFDARARLNKDGNPTTTPFITKLLHLLTQPEYYELIRWNKKGNAILFLHASRELLGLFAVFFRHSNASSFIRQLNIYGFNRAPVQECDVAEWDSVSDAASISAFTHPQFYNDTVTGTACDFSAFKPRLPKTKEKSNLSGTSKRRQRSTANKRASRRSLHDSSSEEED